MDGDDRSDHESLDAVAEILASQRRRYVLRCLTDREPELALADLATEVTARETDRPITELSGEDVRETYLTLHHHHIPKLEDANIVRYDEEKNVVAFVDDHDGLERMLDFVREITA